MPIRKAAFCLALAALLLLASCAQQDWGDTTITNETEFYVRFYFHPVGVYELSDTAPGNTVTFESSPFQQLRWFQYRETGASTWEDRHEGVLRPIDAEVWFEDFTASPGGRFKLNPNLP